MNRYIENLINKIDSLKDTVEQCNTASFRDLKTRIKVYKELIKEEQRIELNERLEASGLGEYDRSMIVQYILSIYSLPILNRNDFAMCIQSLDSQIILRLPSRD